MRVRHRILILLAAAVLAAAAGCSGNMRATRFVNPAFNFSFVERAAVLPFDNLATDREAGVRVTRLMITELLATGAIDVVEPGEVRAAMTRLPSATVQRLVLPSSEEVVALGKDLGVQALIIGTVTQSEVIRTGSVGYPVITVDVHMVETETGSTVWASTHTEKGGSVGAKVLGAGMEPISQTTRRCVRVLVRKLVR